MLKKVKRQKQDYLCKNKPTKNTMNFFQKLNLICELQEKQTSQTEEGFLPYLYL